MTGSRAAAHQKGHGPSGGREKQAHYESAAVVKLATAGAWRGAARRRRRDRADRGPAGRIVPHRRRPQLRRFRPGGSGITLLTLAGAYPRSRFDGYDEAARAIRRCTADDGTWLIKEIRAGETWPDNLAHPVAAMLYGNSAASCLPSGLSEPGGAGLGTLGLPPSRLERLCRPAGSAASGSTTPATRPTCTTRSSPDPPPVRDKRSFMPNGAGCTRLSPCHFCRGVPTPPVHAPPYSGV
jgi:hypothetical protein